MRCVEEGNQPATVLYFPGITVESSAFANSVTLEET
jgi:hypothetical protein